MENLPNLRCRDNPSDRVLPFEFRQTQSLVGALLPSFSVSASLLSIILVILSQKLMGAEKVYSEHPFIFLIHREAQRLRKQ